MQLLHYSAQSNKMLVVSLLFDTARDGKADNEFIGSLDLKDMLYDDSILSQEYSRKALDINDVSLVIMNNVAYTPERGGSVELVRRDKGFLLRAV